MASCRACTASACSSSPAELSEFHQSVNLDPSDAPTHPLGAPTMPRLPNAAVGTLDQAMTEFLVNCSLIVVIAAVTPWRYVWSQLAQATGDQ